MTQRNPLHPAAAVGALLLLAGVLAAVWLGDWRWLASGGVALVAGAVVAAVRA